jgi:hypothetical protein
MLARNFLLIALLPATPGARRLLKFAYEESITGRLVAPGEPPRRWQARALESFGLVPTTIELPVPSFMDCESFHFEATAPPGIELVDIVLGDEDPERRSAGGWSVGYRRVLETSPHRAHLATSRTSNTEPSPDDFLDPHISVRLRVERHGWLRASTYASTFVFLFLFASLRYIDTLDGDAGRINTDPAAFAVAMLAVLSLVIIQVGEHAYTARLVRYLRLLSVVSAMLPIAAAWLLVFPGPGTLLTTGWKVLTVLAGVLSGALWSSRFKKVP